jgi:nicotinamide phosphoribosyltransferase
MDLFAAFNSDGYKLAHGMMYSDGTQLVVNNLTPRSDKIYKRSCTKYYDGKLVFFGAQGAIMEMVENWDKFFNMEKEIAVGRFKRLCDFYLGEGSIPTDSLEKLHDIGYLPLEIRTLDEGTKVKMGIPVMTVRNTVDHAYWLVNFLETTLSHLTWKSSTTATIAAEYKAMMTDFAVRTGVDLGFVLFQGHDFSSRGMSGPEDAARSGIGHLGSFLGTDSLGAILYLEQYYKAKGFIAGSVPATEHAVATSNILRIERELGRSLYQFKDDRQMKIWLKMESDLVDVRLIAEMMFLYELMLKFPKGILSYVTDSFDFWGVLNIGLPYMKEVIEAREGKLVIRPDSGDPVEVICGIQIVDMTEHTTQEIIDCEDLAEDSIKDIGYSYKDLVDAGDYTQFYVRSSDGDVLEINAYVAREYGGKYIDHYEADIIELTVEQKGAAQVLLELFGSTDTSTGYKQYADCIGLIYGDSITTSRCLEILERLEEKGYASSCAVFGVGSFTYNCLTRDTFGFAVKATYTRVNGEDIAIFKDPKTDSKKKSAKGLLYVDRCDTSGELMLVDDVTEGTFESESNLLVIRFLDGVYYNQTSIEEVRAKL